MAPVIRQTDLVHGATAEPKRGRISRVTSARATIEPRGDEIVTSSPCCAPTFLSKLGGDFTEERRLQLGEMRERPRHAASSVMLRQTIGREHVRKVVADGRLRVGIVGARLRIGGRIHLLVVQRIADRGLEWLVMRRQWSVLEPFATQIHPAPSACMMNGAVPVRASSPVAFVGGR